MEIKQAFTDGFYTAIGIWAAVFSFFFYVPACALRWISDKFLELSMWAEGKVE